MKKSRKIALIGILAPLILFFILLYPNLHNRSTPVWEEVVFPLLLLVFIGSCISYAVVTLRESWRNWTGYLAAAAALVPILFIGLLIFFLWDLGHEIKLARTIPPEQFEEFLQRPLGEYALTALFERTEFTPEMLQRIAQTYSPKIHDENMTYENLLARKDKNIPFENMSALMKVGGVARHPNVDVQTLVYLSEVPNPSVHSNVASNPKTPVEILRKLSEEKNEWIDRALARNPNTPADILHDLANSSDQDTRSAVAENPNASKETLQKLAQDTVKSIRLRAKENPNY